MGWKLVCPKHEASDVSCGVGVSPTRIFFNFQRAWAKTPTPQIILWTHQMEAHATKSFEQSSVSPVMVFRRKDMGETPMPRNLDLN